MVVKHNKVDRGPLVALVKVPAVMRCREKFMGVMFLCPLKIFLTTCFKIRKTPASNVKIPHFSIKNSI